MRPSGERGVQTKGPLTPLYPTKGDLILPGVSRSAKHILFYEKFSKKFEKMWGEPRNRGHARLKKTP